MTRYEYWYRELDKRMRDDCIARGQNPRKVLLDGDICGAIAMCIDAEIHEEHMRWAASAVLLVVTIALVAFIFIA